MPLMTWTPSLSVGVKEMDNQHRELVKALNDLFDAMSAGQTKTVMGPLLTSLLKYTRYHFAAEEALLAEYEFPALADHKEMHKKLAKEVEEYVDRYQEGEIGVGAGLLDFLHQWLTQHIKKEDLRYGSWLNVRGLH